MNALTFVLVTLIVLHDVDGHETSINVEQIVTLHRTTESEKGQDNTLMAKGIKCVVTMANGRRISVVEDCGMVRQAIREAQR